MSCGDDGRSGYEQITGETLDISKWFDFEFLFLYGGGINLTDNFRMNPGMVDTAPLIIWLL
jgi:hypothetical protein